MNEPQNITLEQFKSDVLPQMITRHGTGSNLTKAIKAYAQDNSIVDEDNQPIGIDAMVIGDEADSLSDDQIQRIVEKTLSATLHNNSRINKATFASGGRRSNIQNFGNFGEYALAVQKSSAPGRPSDPRLITKAPTTFANETTDAAGGFLVPQEWANKIWEVVLGDESLLSRTNQIPTSRNSLNIPVSSATAWGNTGVQAYWADEGTAITQSRPVLDNRNLRLNKLAALVPASDELLEDATALSAFIGPEAARAIRYKVDDAIINGDGISKPTGIMTSAATVEVAKEVGQADYTLEAANIAKMYSRMPASSVSNSVWLMNQDVLPQLLTMTLGNQPIYMPPNGVSDAPFGMLFGRPVILSQHAQALGNKGDIMFVDLNQYLTLTKAGGIQTNSSIHLWFDYDITAFRFTFRIAGMPWLDAPITPDNSLETISPFVTLAQRFV
ncbi:phage major capsid protein [bacterium AH-315-I18]|nr:phage major capsid protein [Phycisphaeraceae bacterium]MBN4061201.1 phage major capsid protein [bacterium AH-315-I18]